MTTYKPPTENLPIFDPLQFQTGDINLTQAIADTRYLRFPNAQGTENFGAINVNGASIFNSTVAFNDTTPPTSLATQPATNDSSTKIPTTAWIQTAITAGGINLLPLNNAWTGTNSYNQPMSFLDGASSLTIDQIGIDSFITNNQTSGTIFLKTKDGGGTMTDTLTINSDSNGIVALANLNMSGLTLDSVGQINFQGDGTEQTSAYTGAGALAGSYTATNMTIDTNGRITSLTNGTAPSAIAQPSFYAYWQSNTSTIVPNIIVSNYSSWSQNASIKLRVSYTLTYNSNFSSIYTLDCIVDIYPYRLGWLLNSTQSTSYLVNNTLQQIALSPTPATSYYQPNGQSQYSPLGRQYWCSALQQTGANPDGFTIGANNSSVRVFTGAGGTGQFGLAISPPIAGSPTCNHYMSWTILNQGTFPTGTFVSVNDIGATSINPATAYGGSGFSSIS